MNLYRLFLIFPVILFLTLSSCSKNDNSNNNSYLDKPVCDSSFTPKTYSSQVVGFYPSWKLDVMPMTGIRWDKLTRIIYAFALPNTDGTIETGSLVNISQLVDLAHAHGVEVYFSVGGGDGSANYPPMAMNDKTRGRFIKEVKQYIFANCLDGVDIDWEHWSSDVTNTVNPAESGALVSVVKELKQVLEPFHLGISIDLGGSDWWVRDYDDQIVTYVDHLQVMAYDFSGPWSGPGPHSSYEQSIGSGNDASSTGLAYYVNYRHWPKDHILLGVPFYGYNFDLNGGTGIAFGDILTQFPDAYKSDQVNNIYYNGLPTMANKSAYVVDQGYSGIMIWEITQDSPVDSTSLLSTIYSVLNPR